MSDYVVTERDFRQPKFLNADPKDYERRADGEIVRKDRWKVGIQNIHAIVSSSRDEYEIEDVVDAVHKLWKELEFWETYPDTQPQHHQTVDFKLNDGSILHRGVYVGGNFHWNKLIFHHGQIGGWRAA